MKKITILAFWCLLLHDHYLSSTIQEKICAKLLGTEDISFDNARLFQKALADFGIAGDVPLKKVRATAPAWIQQYYSFTWYGIWINEEQFNQLPMPEKIFAAYHEAAHYRYHHPQLVIASNSIIGLVSLGSVYLFTNYLSGSKPLAILSASALTSLLLMHTIPNLSRKHEKEADELAARKLIEKNQEYVVCYVLEQMYQQSRTDKNNSDVWFPLLQERINIIEKVLIPHS